MRAHPLGESRRMFHVKHRENWLGFGCCSVSCSVGVSQTDYNSR